MSISYWRLRDRYYRIIGSICENCQSEFFPPVYICSKCNSNDNSKIKDKEMPNQGIIISYTLLYEPMDGFEDEIPMNIVLIQLTNGVRLVSQLVDCKIDDIKIGKKVTRVFRKIKSESKSGQIWYGYKFRLS